MFMQNICFWSPGDLWDHANECSNAGRVAVEAPVQDTQEPLPSTKGGDQHQEKSREIEQGTWETRRMRKDHTNLVLNPEQRKGQERLLAGICEGKSFIFLETV